MKELDREQIKVSPVAGQAAASKLQVIIRQQTA
jgi:hypothetical protein